MKLRMSVHGMSIARYVEGVGHTIVAERRVSIARRPIVLANIVVITDEQGLRSHRQSSTDSPALVLVIAQATSLPLEEPRRKLYRTILPA